MTTAKLGELASLDYGFAFNSKHFNKTGNGLPLVRIRDVVPGTSTTYFEGAFDERYLVENGDYLIGMDGQFNLAKWRGGTALLNQRVCRVGQLDPLLDRGYLVRFLPLALKTIEDETPFVTVKHLSAKVLKSIDVPVPALSDQLRIAAILDHADALRAKRRHVLAHLDTLAQSIFYDMFGDPIRNDSGFPLRKLAVLGELDRGVSRHRPRNDPALLGGTHPLIQTGDVANSGGYIINHTTTYSDVGLAQSRLWPAGTLCITIAANIAKTGILTFDACFPDSVVGFTSDPETVTYVRVWLGFLQATLEASAPQSAQRNINLAVLRSLEIPTPDRRHLVRFAACVGAIEAQRNASLLARSAEDKLFSALQFRTFRGEF